jgi:hypothetical protein
MVPVKMAIKPRARQVYQLPGEEVVIPVIKILDATCVEVQKKVFMLLQSVQEPSYVGSDLRQRQLTAPSGRKSCQLT